MVVVEILSVVVVAEVGWPSAVAVDVVSPPELVYGGLKLLGGSNQPK